MEIVYILVFLLSGLIGARVFTHLKYQKALVDSELRLFLLDLIVGNYIESSTLKLLNLSQETWRNKHPPTELHKKHTYVQVSATHDYCGFYFENPTMEFEALRILVCIKAENEYVSRTIYGHMFPRTIRIYLNWICGRDKLLYVQLLQRLSSLIISEVSNELRTANKVNV